MACADTRAGCRLKAPAQSARLKVAAHLDELLCKSSGALCKSTALQSQLAKAAVMLLEEGAADTRVHGRRMLWSIKSLLTPQQFAAVRAQHMCGPSARRVLEAVQEGSKPPPAPGRLAQSYAAIAGSANACVYGRKLGIAVPGGSEAGHLAEPKGRGAWDGTAVVGKKLQVGGLPPQHSTGRRALSRHASGTQHVSRPVEDSEVLLGGTASQMTYIPAGRSR